ncbi:hypothetical protein C2G38_2044549 [Gigaspora rosea]|uniref:Uncharacterized protein n=1 Tax=Gigaspora rosea TaxID=44941 RepID=A0A397UK51_9GLOM|nr:hypothetical protein C2G38_2044549 [Gigaspora rosea]
MVNNRCKPVTKKTRSTKKKVDIASRESNASEHSTDDLQSKRPRKSHQATGKENIDLDLENISLDNLQSNANTDNQQSRSPLIELQSRQNYNENLQNQNNKTSQIHDPQKYYNSIRSSAHSSFDASTYQHKAPSQTNKRSIAQSIEPGIDSSSKRPDRHSSNQNHHHYFTDEDESSSEDELFSSLDQHNDPNSFKESHSTALLNMQNVSSYLPTQSSLTTPSITSGLFFQDETHHIRWLEARKDIVLQVLNLICSLPSIMPSQVSSNNMPNLAKILSEQSRILFLRTRIPTKRTRTSLIKGVIPNMVKTHPDWNGISTKLRQAFENFRTKLNQILHSNPSNRDIEEFIAGAVWEKPLKKHIDILDYDVFKNQQSSVKVLKTFIAKSLKIHLEYLIAESKGEDPDYNSMVLNRIKGLDNITINTTFLAASHLQYANQLELKEEQESTQNQTSKNQKKTNRGVRDRDSIFGYNRQDNYAIRILYESHSFELDHTKIERIEGAWLIRSILYERCINRFKKNSPQQTYDLNLRSKKTYLSDYTFSDDLNHNNLSSQNRHANNNQHEISNSLDNDNQQFEPNNYQLDADQQSYNESIDQDYSDQHSFYDLDNIESGQEFEDNANYSDRESIYEYEFSENINSDSLDDECEQTSIDIDNAPKTLDGMKSDINWDHECPFSFFENFTNMAIFVWATKYMISTAAYQDLIQILLHPQFEKKHLTTNLQCLKKQRERLPLMKIQSHMVPINTKNTPSTSKDSTRAYYFSLIEHIQRILNNPSLSSHLYFGPGSFNCGDFVKYHSASKTIEVGRIRSFVIVNKKIATRDQPAPPKVDFFVSKILYNYNGR